MQEDIPISQIYYTADEDHTVIFRRDINGKSSAILASDGTPNVSRNLYAKSENRKNKLKRFVLYCELRDCILRILKKQQTISDKQITEPEQAPWIPDQEMLFDLYELFVENFGRLSDNNLREFSESNDQLLIASLEEIDSETGEAKLSDIFTGRAFDCLSEMPLPQEVNDPKKSTSPLAEKDEITSTTNKSKPKATNVIVSNPNSIHADEIITFGTLRRIVMKARSDSPNYLSGFDDLNISILLALVVSPQIRDCLLEKFNISADRFLDVESRLESEQKLGGGRLSDVLDLAIAKAYPRLNQRVPLNLKHIERVISFSADIPYSALKEEIREIRFAWPRQIAAYISRRLTKASLPQIANFYNRDHTTIMHAHDKVVNALRGNTNGKFQSAVDQHLHAVCDLRSLSNEAKAALFTPEMPRVHGETKHIYGIEI